MYAFDNERYLSAQQKFILERLEAVKGQLATIVGNLNLEYSAERKKLESGLLEAGATTNQAAEILGRISVEAAEKTEQSRRGD